MEALGREFAAVFTLQPQEFLEVELRIVPEDLRQIKAFDHFVQRDFLKVVLG